MKIGIVSDHRGYKLKEQIKKIIKNVEFIDYGTTSTESTDYVDYAFKLAQSISKGDIEKGIAICGSGIGMSIACNKVKGIRCARVNSIKDVIVTRKDNDANIIAFGENINIRKVKRMIEKFINTPFSTEEKHIRRVNKIIEYEQNH